MRHESKPMERAEISLRGLAIGDMFGESYFVHPDAVEGLLASRILSPGPWHYTDDTAMAMSVVSVLRKYGAIDQDAT